MRHETASVLLASGSPRRRELLSLLALPFSIVAADVDETDDGESPQAMVQRLSRAKALAVAARHPGALIVAADTTVALDGRSLGKPANADQATAMLRALRSRRHRVYSGLTVVRDHHMLTRLVESGVWMRHYSDDELTRYVASGDPLDKAGAYAIQHAGFCPVERLEGCFTSVMGLPLCHLAHTLARLGVAVPVDVPVVCRAHTGYACRLFGEILQKEGL